MRVLIVKTTSLGDVIHTLPALTDAKRAYPDIVFDWVVEKPFAEIPTWHPAVDKVIPVAIRQWRKRPLSPDTWKAYGAFKKAVKAHKYDWVIDAQGLIKSAWLAKAAKGKRAGFSKKCAREPLANVFYNQSIDVDPDAHAIQRVRELFAKTLGYELDPAINYNLSEVPKRYTFDKPTVLLLHGTTWPTKHWPEKYWRELAEKLNENNIDVKCVWGNPQEKQRAEYICDNLSNAEVMPKLTLSEIASLIQAMSAVVAVDTGLGHMSAALHKPTLSIYGPTNPKLTGTLGENQEHIHGDIPCRPCMQERCLISDMKADDDPPCLGQIHPELIFKQLQQVLA